MNVIGPYQLVLSQRRLISRTRQLLYLHLELVYLS